MVVVTTKVILGIHSVARAAKLVAFTAEDDTGRRCVKGCQLQSMTSRPLLNYGFSGINTGQQRTGRAIPRPDNAVARCILKCSAHSCYVTPHFSSSALYSGGSRTLSLPETAAWDFF